MYNCFQFLKASKFELICQIYGSKIWVQSGIKDKINHFSILFQMKSIFTLPSLFSDLIFFLNEVFLCIFSQLFFKVLELSKRHLSNIIHAKVFSEHQCMLRFCRWCWKQKDEERLWSSNTHFILGKWANTDYNINWQVVYTVVYIQCAVGGRKSEQLSSPQ